MDKSTKTVLIIIGSVLLVCGCVTAAVFATGLLSYSRFTNYAEEVVSEDPQVAIRFGSEIAEFEVPEGFGSPYGVHFGDVSIVAYKSQSETSHLLLAQFPEGTNINVDEMLQEIKEGTDDPNNIWYSTEMILVEQKPVTIRGQQTMLNLSEGISSDGVAFRMATATFEGRGGPALLVAVGPISEWDEGMVEAFIESIQ